MGPIHRERACYSEAFSPDDFCEDAEYYYEEGDEINDDWWVHYHRRTSSLARGIVGPLLVSKVPFWVPV